MKDVPLNKHPRWSLYKKLRRTIQRELEEGARADEISDRVVDDYLQSHLGEITGEIERLFRGDIEERAATRARLRAQAPSERAQEARD